MPYKDPARIKSYRKEYAIKNRNKLREYFRNYRKTETGRKICLSNSKKWRESEKGKKTIAAYYSTEKYKSSIKINVKRYQQSQKGKINRKKIEKQRRLLRDPAILAKRYINQRVRRGLMPRIETLRCNSCNNQAQARHHYLGYKKENWLDVIPLCIPCHKNAHIEMNEN